MPKYWNGERVAENAKGDKVFIRTGEFRAPKPGEWYLSGAIPCAYYARNGSGIEFHIVRPVQRQATK